MAKESSEASAEEQKRPSPATLKRIQKAYEHAARQMGQGQHKYAAELLAQCVEGDPTNVVYVRTYIENYQKYYNNNHKGASLAQIKELGARAAIKKAAMSEKWNDVLRNGFSILAVNPWDIGTLRSMATAAKYLGSSDCEMYFLKCAFEANPKDVETNRQCARACEDRDQYEQAIAHWTRVEKELPDDEEAKKARGELLVKQTIKKGKYEEETKRRLEGGSGKVPAKEEFTPEERMRRAIAQNPQELSPYLELMTVFVNEDKYDEAERLLDTAREAVGDNPDLTEHIFDLQIRRLRKAAAEGREHRKENDQAEQSYRQARKALNDKEIEAFKFRCERFPTNLRFSYELGLRHQIARDFPEAIKHFQHALGDPRCKGHCLLGLGQSFQAIRQQPLAMRHYKQAVSEISDREIDLKKEALYLTGKLALEEPVDLETAEKYLSDLAGIDFTYKDVAALLDKITRIRDNQRAT